MFVSIGYVQPALDAAMLAGARMGEPASALASPVTGSGVTVTAVEQLLLDASSMGVPIAAMAEGEDVARFRDAAAAGASGCGLTAQTAR